ncbi:Uncharacterised protein [Enterobacter hormaechei]|nr:Uncharacterised protein [Enterobacter hormaechei]
MENLFAVVEHQRAVFRDEGDLIFQLREKGDELVILVAAGDNKFDVTGFKLLKLCLEAVTIVLLGIIKESSVHIGDDNFYGHTVLLGHCVLKHSNNKVTGSTNLISNESQKAGWRLRLTRPKGRQCRPGKRSATGRFFTVYARYGQ